MSVHPVAHLSTIFREGSHAPYRSRQRCLSDPPGRRGRQPRPPCRHCRRRLSDVRQGRCLLHRQGHPSRHCRGLPRCHPQQVRRRHRRRPGTAAQRHAPAGQAAQGPRCPRHPGPGIEHVAGPGPGQRRDGPPLPAGQQRRGRYPQSGPCAAGLLRAEQPPALPGPAPGLRADHQRYGGQQPKAALLSGHGRCRDHADPPVPARGLHALRHRSAADPRRRPGCLRHPSWCGRRAQGPAGPAHGPRAGGRKRGGASGHARGLLPRSFHGQPDLPAMLCLCLRQAGPEGRHAP